jgi:hypothetical protein
MSRRTLSAQHRVLQAGWSEADADARADQLEEQFPVADLSHPGHDCRALAQRQDRANLTRSLIVYDH